MSDVCLQNAKTSIEEVADKKLSLKDLQPDTVSSEVIHFLASHLFHRIAKSLNIFRAILGSDFLADIGDVSAAVSDRHHIVHCDGYSKDGNSVALTQRIVEQRLDCIAEFANLIQNECAKVLIVLAKERRGVST